MNEERLIFKAFLRGLQRDLKKVKEARENKDYETAEEILDQLIEDIQKGIED